MKNCTDIVKDFKELNSHFSSESATGTRNDPPILNDTQPDTGSSHITAKLIDTSAGSRPDAAVEEEEEEELRRRSAFLHQLLFSTFFNT
ncbi:hypothetical protein M569_03351 [Genlisea aurea]|uniref:Protein dehydration-induced 19 C-terminal domain-containing protein n=1 Tax=Genlisea aurea TaxID=192259 RepID=S8CX05_9LAMI|nr:hypothetical protein M569_03351 [Genlisea aurea]